MLASLAEATQRSCRFVLPSEAPIPALTALLAAAHSERNLDGTVPGTSVSGTYKAPQRIGLLGQVDHWSATTQDGRTLPALPTVAELLATDPATKETPGGWKQRELRRAPAVTAMKLTPEEVDALARFAVFEGVISDGGELNVNEKDVTEIALRANLLTPFTSLVLVKVRPEDEGCSRKLGKPSLSQLRNLFEMTSYTPDRVGSWFSAVGEISGLT